MKCFLIDARARKVSEVEMPDDRDEQLTWLQSILDGPIEEVGSERVYHKDGKGFDCLYVDEEGLIKEGRKYGIVWGDGVQLVGNGVIVGITYEDGETCPPGWWTIDEVKQRVQVFWEEK